MTVPAADRAAARRPAVAVRGLRPGDDEHVVRLFRDTLVLGRPLGFSVPHLDAYTRLCLHWYLHHERSHAAVLEDDGAIVGYVLVCTDSSAFDRWLRRAAARYLLGLAPALVWSWVRGTSSPSARRFHVLRLRDGWDAWRHSPSAPAPAHAHFNLARSARALVGGRLLIGHVDDVCRRHGIAAWSGEMNAEVGRRSPVLVRYGAEIVHRHAAHTFSWLAGQPVERLTVVRRLDRAVPLFRSAQPADAERRALPPMGEGTG